MTRIMDRQMIGIMLLAWEPAESASAARIKGLSVARMMARGVLCLREPWPGGMRNPGLGA